MTLIGRASELAALAAAVTDVTEGGTRVLLISGEPGIGKSALLDALAEQAAGLTVLRARAAEQEQDVPFALAVEALDDAVADLHPTRQASLEPGVLPSLGAAEESASAAQRFRLHRALRGVLEELATAQPVALLLDDLHWADQASVEWILHAIRRPARRPHLLALALREVDPLAQLLDAGRGVAEHIALAPLADADAHALLTGVPDAQRPRLVAEAGGNPLYLQGLARSDGARLPATVLAAVQQEIATLPPASRALIEGAAVAGDPFDADLAAIAAGIDQDADVALDRLANAGLVQPADGARLRFRHPLVRRAVYDAAPAGWRITAHERLAAELTARGMDAVGLAYHVEQAARVGDKDAAQTLAQAGHESAARAPGTAARWYRAALRLDPGMDAEQRAGLMAALAQALAATGRPAEAREVLLELLAVFPSAELVAITASVEHALGLHAEAAARIDAALADGPEPALRARLDFERATGAVYMQDVETLRAFGGKSVAELQDSEPALAAADEAVGAIGALWAGHPEETPERLGRMRAAYARVRPEMLAARPEASFSAGYAEYANENLVEALTLLTEGLAIIRGGAQDRMLAPMATLHALASWTRGDLSGAVESAEVAEETARLLGLDYTLQWTLWVRALIVHMRGEPELAARLAEECLGISDRIGDLLVTRAGRAMLATLHVDTDPERAVAQIEAIGFENVDLSGSSYIGREYVRALLALGRDAEAATTLLEGRTAAARLPLSIVRAKVARAEVQLRNGEPAAATAREAAAEASARNGELDATVAELTLGRALAVEGDRDGAVEALRSASRRAAAHGMWAHRDMAKRELRRLGSRLDSAVSVAGDDHDLTDRERQVADHVALGRSNKEIATLLFLSPKTIEHTLTRVYAKVGVKSRTALAAALR